MNRASKIINLDYAKRQNLTGKGIGIAILDTGIGYHPDLFSQNHTNLIKFVDILYGKKDFYDDNGHGTHIAGIIAGSGCSCNGLFRGIAPNCHIVCIKVLNSRGEGCTEYVLAGIEWLLKNHKKYNIRIVNISVGSTKGKNFSENSPLVVGVEKLWDAGLIVFTAAGNHGPGPGSIGAPGNSRKIITVGSSDIINSPYEIDFSGRGPTETCIKKPDVVAPGSHITSCYPMSGKFSSYSFLNFQSSKDNVNYYNGTAYMSRTGTSMSTPIVSGCVALLLQKHPHLTNKQIKLRLKETCLDLGYPHSRQGWGLIQCQTFLK